MESVTIQRQGSYFYTRAYWQVVLLLTVVYGGMGAVLAIVTESDLEDVLEEIIFPILAFIPVLLMWLTYALMLAAFKRDAKTAVEVSREGIRETYKGRERQFIPWAGMREIELDADWLGGATLRARGNFSAIAISNVDLVVTRPMRLWEMHRALGRTGEIVHLFVRMKEAAPQAESKMNNLARKKLDRYALANGDAAKR
ncbi:MAG TPA: hypothetical protein VJZ91_18755 [Blastocatellia bacterium]|nr:hypothetical protein [Blastocatellia bacterium]